jgi:hypothetical protein
VNGKAFSAENLKSAITASSQQPIRLSIDVDGEISTVVIPYQGSLRYPHLVRIPGTVDGLAKVLAPK